MSLVKHSSKTLRRVVLTQCRFAVAPKATNNTNKTKSGSFSANNKKDSKVDAKESNSAKVLVESINKFIDAAESSKRYKPEFSPEEMIEHERIAKAYQRQSTLRHNSQEKDLSLKIWLQQEAMASIPAHLQATEAQQAKDEIKPPPLRPWPIYCTPPIKGFNYKDYVKADGDDLDETQA